MAEIKTKQTNADVHDFINAFADTDQKRKDDDFDDFVEIKQIQEHQTLDIRQN